MSCGIRENVAGAYVLGAGQHGHKYERVKKPPPLALKYPLRGDLPPLEKSLWEQGRLYLLKDKIEMKTPKIKEGPPWE